MAVWNTEANATERLLPAWARGVSEFLVVSAARRDKFSMVRARPEEQCQELSNVIKYLSERQDNLLAMMWNVRET